MFARGSVVESPFSYRAQVSEFRAWLARAENAAKSAQEKATQFFNFLGLNQQNYTALHVQHVAGLALRELLAQNEDVGSGSFNVEPGLRAFTDRDGGRSYIGLDSGHFNRLQSIFGTDISLVAPENFATPAPARAIFALGDHFAIQDGYVISNGTCLTAAFGMHLANLADKSITSQITDAQLIAYRDSPATYANPVSANPGSVLSNGLPREITFAAQAPQTLSPVAIIDALIAQSDVAAISLKAELATFVGGTNEFIQAQKELFAEFERIKIEHSVTGVHAAPFYNEAKSKVLANHPSVATPSA